MATPTATDDEEKIDDKYWFSLGKKMIDNSVANLETSSSRLQAVITWLWGIYTAGAAVGIALANLSLPWYMTALVFLPSATLIVAYLLSAWAQTSVPGIFNNQEAIEIKANYEEISRIKYTRFKLTLLFVVISVLLVILALALTSFSRQPVTPDFNAAVHTQDNQDVIALTGNFPADTNIIVSITPYSAADVPGAVKELPYVTSSSGEIQTSISLDTQASKYDVVVSWQEDDGLSRSLQRSIQP